MLFVKLAKAVDDWWWCNDKIGNIPELGYSCLGKFVMGGAKGWMESTGYEAVAIALCDSLLWLMIVVRDAWSLAPFFFWTQGTWGSPLCNGQFYCHGTCNTDA
jgi:hypothetical protein